LKKTKSGQPTVLVVDDDESLQSLFKIFLKKIGFSRVVVGTLRKRLRRSKTKIRSSLSGPEIAGWPG